MQNVIISSKDEVVMRLVHYFVTKEDYTPIVVQGAKNEIWLENLSGPYKIIRINTGYIHNNEQFEHDMKKIKHVLKQIKKKTLSLKISALNICLDTSDRVEITEAKGVDTVKLKSVNEINKNESLQSAFPSISIDENEKVDNLDFIINVTEDINKKTEKDNALFEQVFKKKTIVVTRVITAICVIMFALTYIFGNGSTDVITLLKFGGNNIDFVKAGEIYRLITSMFLHAGFIHLFVNMYSLNIIGTQLENFIGKWRFLGIYLFSGISGSLLSLVLNDSLTVSVGASGAIFGLMGALLYFGYHYRLYLNQVIKTQLVPIILLNLFIGFSLSGIDNAAHIGGLVGGYLAATAFGVKGKSTKNETINGSIALLILIAFLSYMVFR